MISIIFINSFIYLIDLNLYYKFILYAIINIKQIIVGHIFIVIINNDNLILIIK